MANSKLICWDYKGYTENFNTRNHKIDKITPHHQAGNLTFQQVVNSLNSRGGSVNYIIQSDGKIGCMIDEQYRAWTSNSRDNDMRAVTIEVANDEIGGNWHVSDKALKACINLCVDICKRNGIKALNFTGDSTGNLTMHKYFTATACPGPYLASKFKYIAEQVNKQLNAKATETKATATKTSFKSYKVRITCKDGLNVRTAAGVGNKIVDLCKYNYIYTIVAEKVVSGQTWGKLKSGAGWICLTGFTKKV